MRQDPFGRPMAATVSASRGSARRPVRKSSFLSAMSAVPRPHLRADAASGHLRRAIARAAGARRPDRWREPSRSASSASSPAPSTRQESRARSTIAANVGSTMPSRARRAAEAERGTRQDLTSTTGAPPSRSARRAARPSDVVFQSRVMRRVAVDELHRQPYRNARFRDRPAYAGKRLGRLQARRAWRTASCPTGAWRALPCDVLPPAENPCSAWAARTTSAKVPPPGTITQASRALPTIFKMRRCGRSRRGCRRA